MDLYRLGWRYDDIAKALEEDYDTNPEFYEEEIREVLISNGHPSWLKGRQIVKGEVIETGESAQVRQDGQGEISARNRCENSPSVGTSERWATPRTEVLPLPILSRLAPDKPTGEET